MSTHTSEPTPLITGLSAPDELRVSHPDDDPQLLRDQLHRDGYLLVRGLIDRVGMARARADVLALCRREGWLKTGTPDDAGISAGILPDAQHFQQWYIREFIRLPSFNAVAVQPGILQLFTTLLDGPILSHPRTIGRVVFPVPPDVTPGSARYFANTTQPHQDFFYIRGSEDTYTAWMPTADCPRPLGGLAILRGSHRHGCLPHRRTTGAGNHGVDVGALPGSWLSADFQVGDALIFHSHTIHGALDNRSGDRLRISFDFRYQRAAEAVDPASLLPHGGG